MTKWLPRIAFAPPKTDRRGDVLIVIFLRGAADVLNMVVPHGDDAYYAWRPSLAIARPDDLRHAAQNRTIDLDGFFGLHPQLGGLLPAWQAQQFAIIHACGAPDESRSHFKAMELMERGTADERGPASGWIGRHLAALDARADTSASPFRAVAIGETVPRSLLGVIPATALRSIADFHLSADARASATLHAALSVLYRPALHTAQLNVQAELATGARTLAMLNILAALKPEQYRPAHEVQYPNSEFGRGLKQVAMLVKADIGMEVAALDLGGWDTHFAQGNATGLMAALLHDLGSGLAALHGDLSDQMQHINIVVMSEFGRRAAENGSLGTDHGHGSAMFVLGGAVRGRRVHGRWPGLDAEQLVGPGDLAVTTDYRDVLGELCARRLKNSALEAVFPGHNAQPVGVFL